MVISQVSKQDNLYSEPKTSSKYFLVLTARAIKFRGKNMVKNTK